MLALAPATLLAQEPGQDRVTITAGGRVLEADWGESKIDTDGRRVTVLAGRVEFRLGDTTTGGETIRADRAIAWSVDGSAEPQIKELYVEGNITFRRLDPKTKKETVFRAERLYVDFVAQKVVAIDLKARTWSDRFKTPLLLNAKEARSIAQGTLEATDIIITTCTYGDPDYRVLVARGTVKGEMAREKRTPYDLWPYESWTVRGEGLSAEIWGLPFFFFPAVALGSALSEFPIKSVRGGTTSRFGYYVYADWGLSIRKGWVDRLNPWDAGAADDDRDKWGEFIVESDWRQKRGFAGGLDYKYGWQWYSGYVDTYFLRDDEGPDPSNGFEQKFLPFENHRRWRARTFNRFDFADDWRFEVEASHLSDRHLLEEFFEKEFKEGKEQESVAYLRWIDGNVGGYLLERHRLNDFQTQLEYLPRAHVLVSDQALLPESLTLSQHVDIAHLRLRQDEDVAAPDARTWRGDALTELGLALDLGFVSISPFTDVRVTAWEEDLTETARERVLTTVGARAVATIHGVHDVMWESVGLRRLRHLMQVDVQFTDTLSKRIDDEAVLFRYDDVDVLDRFRELAIEIRHRFQTKVKQQDRLVTWEFLELGVEAEYYPKPGRDTTTPDETNFAAPYHWITLAPSTSAGAFSEREWSNLHWYVRFNPAWPLSVRMDGEYNPVDAQEEAREISVWTRPIDTMTLSVGEIFLKDVTTALSGSLKWQITEKWAIDVSAQYDFEADTFLKRRLQLSRDFHDFLFEVVYEDNESRDERKFYVTLVPKLLKRPKENR
jgi:hypothetical protein